MIQPDFCLHIANMAGNHVKNRKILGKCLRKTHVARSGHLQGKNLRKQHYRRQTSGQQGIHRKLKPASHKFLPVHLLIQHQQGNEIQHHKYAGHDGDIIIGKNGQPQCQAVEHSFSISDQPLQAQNNERKQDDAVQPHDIPAVGRHISGQCVEDTEKGNTKIIGPTVLP